MLARHWSLLTGDRERRVCSVKRDMGYYIERHAPLETRPWMKQESPRRVLSCRNESREGWLGGRTHHDVLPKESDGEAGNSRGVGPENPGA